MPSLSITLNIRPTAFYKVEYYQPLKEEGGNGKDGRSLASECCGDFPEDQGAHNGRGLSDHGIDAEVVALPPPGDKLGIECPGSSLDRPKAEACNYRNPPELILCLDKICQDGDRGPEDEGQPYNCLWPPEVRRPRHNECACQRRDLHCEIEKYKFLRFKSKGGRRKQA